MKAKQISTKKGEKIMKVEVKDGIKRTTLTRGESIEIEKGQEIKAVLKWTGVKNKNGEDSGDLDFYCFYIKKGAEKCGKIYYKNLGSIEGDPHIQLLGDSEVPGEETIIINDTGDLEYVLLAVYSAAENGKGGFALYKPTITVSDSKNEVVLPITEVKNSYWVALCHINFTGSAAKILHCERYSGPSLERSPLIYKDGTFKMDVGDIEFKAFDLKAK